VLKFEPRTFVPNRGIENTLLVDPKSTLHVYSPYNILYGMSFVIVLSR